MKIQMKTLARLSAIVAFALLAACQSSNNKPSIARVAGVSGNGATYATGTVSGNQVIAELLNPQVAQSTDGSGNIAFTVAGTIAIQIGSGVAQLPLQMQLTQATMQQGGGQMNQPLANGINAIIQVNCSDGQACSDLLMSVLVVINTTPAAASQFGFIYATNGANVAQGQGGISNVASYNFPQVTNATNIIDFPDVEATLMSTVPGN